MQAGICLLVFKSIQYLWLFLTLLMLYKLRCHAHFQFPAYQITWSGFSIEIHIFNDNNADPDQRPFRSQLIWIYTICWNRAVFSKRSIKWKVLPERTAVPLKESFPLTLYPLTFKFSIYMYDILIFIKSIKRIIVLLLNTRFSTQMTPKAYITDFLSQTLMSRVTPTCPRKVHT